MIIRRLKIIFIAMTCLAMMSACRDFESDRLVEQSVGDCYINIAIAVSGGTTHTRADDKPLGGEDGNGREAGFERENTVTGITLILYQDDAGINTSDNPALDLVRYFHVSGREIGTDPIEVTYTTGQQNIGRTLDYTKSYRAIVIANANLEAELKNKKLDDVRKYPLSTVYYGTPMSPASSCSQFVMSSESDVALTFGTPKNLDGTTYTKGQDMYFDLTSQPITIERMAARIDFHSANSNDYKDSYTTPGYEYNVTSSSDKFVVTGVVPFNLANGHATFGEEYLIKRVAAKAADLSLGTISYLAEETTNSYVVDPQTLTGKTTDNPYLTNYLSHATDATLGLYPQLPSSVTSNPYYHSVKDMHDSDAKSTIDSKENVVVAYPMENTLNTTTKPYYYATGVAVVGDYYVNGKGTPTTYVYLSYLRHQGDAESYNILPYTTPLEKTETMGATPAMKYGVVRNNIYRISIKSIDKKGSMELSIKVKKWDPYIHDYIYM